MPLTLRNVAAAGLLALLAQPSHAQSWEYYFGSAWGETSFQPSHTFAHLSVSTSNYQSFDFLLRAYDPSSSGTLVSAFGSSSYIGQAIFNTVSGDNPTSVSNVQTNGYVSNVFLTSSDPNVGGVTFDFGDCFGGGSNCSYGGDSGRLQSGEWVSWTLNFASVQNPFFDEPPVALHVRSFGLNNDDSGWYTPTTPIPEPQTYAMLIAGLLLVAFAMGRRQRELAAA